MITDAIIVFPDEVDLAEAVLERSIAASTYDGRPGRVWFRTIGIPNTRPPMVEVTARSRRVAV